MIIEEQTSTLPAAKRKETKMQKTVATFEINYRQLLNEAGELLGPLPDCVKDPEHLVAMYKMMLQTRSFDAKAIALQRTGKLGTYPSSLGQEAISVAIGAAMQKEDVLCPYYREYGAQFWRGVTMTEMYLFWGGSELGSDFRGPKEDMPCCIPIASQTLHAVGVGFAMKHRKQRRAAVTVIGDGGTSRGDFYEAVNVAGNWKLPVVFVVNNNQWAISVPREAQTACQTFAQKAIAGGVPSEQVDGNDIVVMRDAMDKALTRAYAGEGPTVIEAITYRMCDHTTADDARRYRSETEVKAEEAKDPIKRLNAYLQSIQAWDQTQEETWAKTCKQNVQAAVEKYLATPKQAPASMMEFLYEDLPEAYEDQRQNLLQVGENHG